MLTRRATLAGAAALAACAHEGRGEREALAEQNIGAIEARIGGRCGVAALNIDTGAWIANRPHERFAMASTFKWLLAAQMLQMGERDPNFLGQRVLFNESDLLEYAPATRARITDMSFGRAGEMTIEELSEAIVVVSDNTAANLLLDGAFGPEGFTRFLRANGDGVTRLDRTEPTLNQNAPGDERDTTTPDAMARTMQRFLVGDSVLNAAARQKQIGWLIACRTGLSRLRAGLPSDWIAGDKTGTGLRGAANDVAIAWPRGRAPIVIASYMSDSEASTAELSAAHAEIARAIVEAWS